MPRRNLFSRLCTYSLNKEKLSGENFLTEVLAHLFETDKTFKKALLRTLISDGLERKKYYSSRVTTQHEFIHSGKKSIVDLVLWPSKKRVSPLLVEVKIRAQETLTKLPGQGYISQIKKYVKLNVGSVIYFASVKAPEPQIIEHKRFLGQKYIENLHRRLDKPKYHSKLTELGREFVAFLEEEGMAHSKPFTAKELGNIKEAFSFAAKSVVLLEQIVDDYEQDFHKSLKTKASFTPPVFKPKSGKYGSVYNYLRNLHKWPFGDVGLSIEPDGNSAYFVVWCSPQKDADAVAKIKKAGFYCDDPSQYPYWYESMQLKGGPKDYKRMCACVERALTKLAKALK